MCVCVCVHVRACVCVHVCACVCAVQDGSNSIITHDQHMNTSIEAHSTSVQAAARPPSSQTIYTIFLSAELPQWSAHSAATWGGREGGRKRGREEGGGGGEGEEGTQYHVHA